MQTTSLIAHLWTAARALHARMCVSLGPPELISWYQTLAPEVLRDMRAWLRTVEATLRRLILLEAAALAREPAPRNKSRAVRDAAKPLPRTRAPVLRLWPRQAPAPARIRLLGPPILVRDIYRERKREALARQLNAVRFMRPREPLRIARRMEAIARVFEYPLSAIRRLARKLRALPKLAIKLAAARWPRSPYADHDFQDAAGRLSYRVGMAADTS